MRFKLGVRGRLLFAMLGIVSAAFVFFFCFFVTSLAERGNAEALRLGRVEIERKAVELSGFLERSVHPVSLTAGGLRGVTLSSAREDIVFFETFSSRIFAEHSLGEKFWLGLDYRLLDTIYPHYNGYFLTSFIKNPRMAGGIERYRALYDTSGLNLSTQYIEHRDAACELVSDPYYDYLETRSASGYVVTFTSPVYDADGLSVGVVAVDLPLDALDERISVAKFSEGAYSFLINDTFRILAGAGGENVGKGARDVLHVLSPLWDYADAIARGELVEVEFFNEGLGEHAYFFSHPVWVGESPQPLVLCMVIPKDELRASSAGILQFAFWWGVLAYGLIVVVLFFEVYRITRPLRSVSYSLSRLAAGEIDSSLSLSINTGDELESIGLSINRLLEGMEGKAHFAQSIGTQSQRVDLLIDSGDVLGRALLDMRERLQETREREERQRQVEEQQAWATRGEAKFAELMRVDSDNLEDFAYRIVHEICQYVEAEVGALYLRGREKGRERHLTMVAAYAYEVRKYVSETIAPGEGLVGRCAMEQDRVYMTDIPSGYVRIASGLGYSEPNALLLLPVMMNDMLEGVLELANFGGFPEYVIRFVEGVASTLASTLVTLQNNLQTKQLLVDSQLRSEEMRAQEEEMRQNMEELKAIQEDSLRQAAEMESLNRALQSACCLVEYDLEGRVIYANSEYLSTLRVTLQDVLNRPHAENLIMTSEQARGYHVFWQDLKLGQTKRNVLTRVEAAGRVLTFNETYAPILDERGKVLRIVKIAFNITDLAHEGGVSSGGALGEMEAPARDV